MNTIKKSTSLLVVFLLAHIIPILSRLITSRIIFYEIFPEPLPGLFTVTITYLLQIAFAILALRICIRDNISNVGFNLRNKDLSIKIYKKFILIWSLIVASFFVLAINFLPGFDSYIQNICPLNFYGILKNFITGVILAGIGEEPLFRSFVVLALIKYWDNSFSFGKITVPYVAILSGFIFMTAHIGYDVYPVSARAKCPGVAQVA